MDVMSTLQEQMLSDNQEHARAWHALTYKIASDAASVSNRKAQNNESFDHAIDMNAVPEDQTGATENQQTVSPVRTGAADAIVGGVGVSAEQVAANIATLTTAISAALAEFYAAMVAVNVNAAGGASTPSQTQPKPAA